MASIEKRAGGYLARVRRKGNDRSAMFPRKAEALAWAAKIEAEIASGKGGGIIDRSFGELIERYIELHAVKLDGAKQDVLRLRRVLTYPIAKARLPDFCNTHVAEWRDARSKEVSADSVLREWSSLSHACEIAIKEWQWLHENPFRAVKKPDKPAPRTRILSDDEIERLVFACGYEAGNQPTTKQAMVGVVLLFAIETAMRAGEICALKWADFDPARRIIRVTAIEHGARKTKSAREIPLSVKALSLLALMRGLDAERVFPIATASLDVLFRKAKARALIEEVHFHDSRATALTRLASKVGALQLAKISGHKDLRILLNTYYREDMSELVDQIG
jgi:integrase